MGGTTANQLTYIRAFPSPSYKAKRVCKQINISAIKKEKKNKKAIQLSGSVGNGKRGEEARLSVAVRALWAQAQSWTHDIIFDVRVPAVSL